jgi:sugar-phosphatase
LWKTVPNDHMAVGMTRGRHAPWRGEGDMSDAAERTSGKTWAAFLFDMDGTVLDSIAVTERIWGRWAERHGLDVDAFLPTIHGVRAADTIARLGIPGVDVNREAEALLQAEMADVDGIRAIPGAVEFLNALPPERWAIVTSAGESLALRRIAAAGIPRPAVLVTSEDVSRGKPAPDCFLLAAERLGVDARQCLVFEDAPAGILAAETSGADVMVVTATHARTARTRHRTLASYEGLAPVRARDGLQLSSAGAAAATPRRAGRR